MIMKYGECSNNEGIIDMSYGSEIAEERRISYDVWYYNSINNIENGIWLQKDGSKIHIHKMTNQHITNCINMLKKKVKNNSSNEIAELWINRFEKELEYRQYIKDIVSGVLEE